MEEVPFTRQTVGLRLEALTPELSYGPVHSRSVGRPTRYEIKFFRLLFAQEPTKLLQSIGGRSRNVLVRQGLLLDNTSRVSGLIKYLHEVLPGGIPSIPLAWDGSLRPPSSWGNGRLDQFELCFA